MSPLPTSLEPRLTPIITPKDLWRGLFVFTQESLDCWLAACLPLGVSLGHVSSSVYFWGDWVNVCLCAWRRKGLSTGVTFGCLPVFLCLCAQNSVWQCVFFFVGLAHDFIFSLQQFFFSLSYDFICCMSELCIRVCVSMAGRVCLHCVSLCMFGCVYL